ncbi:hypothetical protein ACFLSA_05140 [Bacteroidota bacterium]
MKIDKKLYCDFKEKKFKSSDEANAMLNHHQRKLHDSEYLQM